MSFLTEKIAKSAGQHMTENLEHIILGHGFITESPIEDAFIQAILAFCLVEFDYDFRFGNTTNYEPLRNGALNVGVETQVKCESRRIDIVLSGLLFSENLDGNELRLTSRIAIECDGFKYHHGSPIRAAQDKARDREIAPYFDAVIRFTGAEINANPFSCAMQAIKVLEAKL